MRGRSCAQPRELFVEYPVHIVVQTVAGVEVDAGHHRSVDVEDLADALYEFNVAVVALEELKGGAWQITYAYVAMSREGF